MRQSGSGAVGHASVLCAKWVLPVSDAPIRDGWVEVVDGRVRAVGGGRPTASAEVTDLGDVVLMPGLVNAHTHLELSWMAGLVPPASSMDEWIKTLMQVRRAGPAGGVPAVHSSMAAAADAMRASGTVLVGDISNTLVSPPVLAASGLGGVIFHEVLGFNAADPARLVRDAWARVQANDVGCRFEESDRNDTRRRVCFSVVAHAPYSVSPALFGEIARQKREAPLSVHLAESAEEIEFLHTGRGPIRDMLETLGVWSESWRAPACDPVRYLADLGYLKPGTLLVHGVHLTPADLDQAREAEAVIVTCPRSNVWVGGGVPPVARFYGSGVAVAIGTDSLASVDSMNLFDELEALRRTAPEVEAARLLESATQVGADALGLGREFGSISPGRRAIFVSVTLPPAVGARAADVEEYLVSGVPLNAVAVVDLTAP